MTNKERNAAKETVFENIQDTLETMSAVNYGGEFDWAVPVLGEDGKTTYVTVELTAKNNTTYTDKKGTVVPAFDPIRLKQQYDEKYFKKAQDASAARKKS